jgi:hypothetical protein
VRSRILLVAGGVVVAAVVAWLVFDSNGDDEQSVAEQLGALFKPECEEGGGIYAGIAPASPIALADLAKWHGRRFKTVIDHRALEANVIGCDAAGGGPMVFELTNPRAAERAAKAYRGRPVCVVGKSLFDDDFVDNARDQLARFCQQVDGRLVD